MTAPEQNPRRKDLYRSSRWLLASVGVHVCLALVILNFVHFGPIRGSLPSDGNEGSIQVTWIPGQSGDGKPAFDTQVGTDDRSSSPAASPPIEVVAIPTAVDDTEKLFEGLKEEQVSRPKAQLEQTDFVKSPKHVRDRSSEQLSALTEPSASPAASSDEQNSDSAAGSRRLPSDSDEGRGKGPSHFLG